VQGVQGVQAMREPATALLTAVQVGDLLGIDQSTVYRMAADGRLPAVKVGRQWRFPARVVQDLLGGSRDGPPSGADRSRGDLPDVGAAVAATTIAADLLGVMMVVTDMQGRPLTPVANPCPRFARLAGDAEAVQACATEWRALADELDLQPHFRAGALGFECARAHIRTGDRLVGMVLAGGLAPEGDDDPDLYHLDAGARSAVLAALPRVAAALSTNATPTRRSSP
jgi:excisionase family DNA binding protein